MKSTMTIAESLGVLSARTWLRFGFVTGFVAIVMMVAGGLSFVETSLRSIEQVDQVAQARLLASRLNQGLTDAETGVRGFLLTGEPRYLEPYEEAVSAIRPTAAALVEAVPDEAGRVVARRIQALVDDELTILRNSIALRTMEGESLAEHIAAGRSVMDKLRADLEPLRESLLLTATRARALTQSELQRTRVAVLGFGIGASLLVGLVLLLTERQMRLREQLTAALNERKSSLEVEVAARTREITALSRHLGRVEEEEKFRLARELHDELGAILTAARMEAAWLQRSFAGRGDEQLDARLERLMKWLGEGVAIKRRVIDDLRPPLLDSLGLAEALRDLADDFQRRKEIGMDFQADPDLPLVDEEAALALYRIAQEALTNIQKHAQATQVVMSLDVLDDGRLCLRISDNGKGFDPAAISAKRHGLVGIRHRADMLEGSLEVVSAPGQGCTLTVCIAVQPVEAV